MNIKICGTSYTLNTDKPINLLSTLFNIKHKQNRSLSFKSGCKSGICGSCAVRVNGIEVLACKTNINDNDEVMPLNNLPLIKDLVVNSDSSIQLQKAKASLHTNSQNKISNEDKNAIDLESNCILCSSCISVCPVYTVNQNFIAPYALMRNYRYINDKKEKEIDSKLKAVQENGIWDCTLCGNCNLICPSQIDIKGDIQMLRNKSAQFGYNNKNLDIGFNTNLDFMNQDIKSCGFDPNAF